MRQFTLEISYSQIAVFNPSIDRPFNNWTEEHFHQGFVWRPMSVSFRTASKTGQGRITVERVKEIAIRDDAMVAISVPFTLTEPHLEVASVFKGESFAFEPGEYELVFQTGRQGIMPWVELQFIPRQISEARILKGAEHLKPAAKLDMAGEPA